MSTKIVSENAAELASTQEQMIAATRELVATLRAIANGLDQCGAAAGRITDLAVLGTLGREYETMSMGIGALAESASEIAQITVPFLAA